MRIAALYDIHGNLPALEAVLEDVRRASVDLVVIGGDVFPGPMSIDCLSRLMDLDMPLRFLRGNGDRATLAVARGEAADGVPEQALEGIRWLARKLTPEHRRQMAGWPESVHAEVDGLGKVLFCHATPRNDIEIFTRRTPEDRLLKVFAGIGVPLVVCGHTHMQFDRTVGGTRVVNAGSVGMPFGEPGAYWLLLGPEAELRHTAYDLEAAAERIRATDYPQAQDFAANNILRPPSEEEILERFAGAELT